MPDNDSSTSSKAISFGRLSTPGKAADVARRPRYTNVSGDSRFNREQGLELAGLDPTAFLTEADLKAATDRLMATRLFDHASIEWLGADGLHIWLEPLKLGEKRLKSERVNVEELFQVLTIFGRHVVEKIFYRCTTAFRFWDEDPDYVRGIDDGSRWASERFSEIKSEYIEGKYFTHLRYTILYARILKNLEQEFAEAIRVSNFVFEGFVGDRPQSDKNRPPLEERERQLVAFADAHSGVDVLTFVRHLFPEAWERSAPVQATPSNHSERPTELWQGGRGKTKSPTGEPEDVIAFIKRVYEPWLGKGFTRTHLRQLDSALATALDNWLRNNEMPPDLDLPTAAEMVTRRLDELQADPEKPTTMTLSEARRLVDAERKRAQRAKES